MMPTIDGGPAVHSDSIKGTTLIKVDHLTKTKKDYKHKTSSSKASRLGAGYFLLNISCGFCVFLNIICSCTTIILILLGQHIDVAQSISDSVRTSEIAKMADEVFSSEITFRLPKEVKPLQYDLFIHPDLTKETFSGHVSILIKVSQKRKFLMLHQKELNISDVNLKINDCAEKCNTDIRKSYPLDKKEVFIIVPQEELDIGIYNLSLSFTGSLTNKIVGFYSSKYKNEQNSKSVIATSKFEPTYARRCFPCFDEPGFKAEFNIKLVHPNNDCYHALSNMNVKSTSIDEPSAGLTTVTFAKSVPMSTYLACFIVSDFVSVTHKAKGLDGKTFPISVYTTRAQKEKGAFALDIGVQIIEYYIKLFKIDYPLPKLDMAAIPDFVSGAMENWGLVTYREARLLYDANMTSTANKEDIVLVIAHEFAHMWFGNLVTMAWWNDLWLNEGFATFMQFKSSDAILPEWNFMDHFLLNELHPAFATDAKINSHPIVQTVNNPDEINAIFDVISYQKGASILRMLENFVGSEVFFTGVTKYLKKFAYENAETADLFNMIQNSLDKRINVTAIMDTWTRQMGFPVVKVTKNKSGYTLTQKRFLSNPNSSLDLSESPYGYKWTIPITYTTSQNDTPTLIWFDKDASDLTIKLEEPVEWIKFNSEQVGYYRVNYNSSEWESLLKVLQWSHKRFSSSDRTHLLEDAFSLADAGELDYTIAMNITLYLASEKHFSPWYVAANKIKTMDSLLSSTDTSSKFRMFFPSPYQLVDICSCGAANCVQLTSTQRIFAKIFPKNSGRFFKNSRFLTLLLKVYVQKLVDGIYHDVTWNVDNMEEHNTLNLRSTVLGLACSVGHVECLEEVGSIFRDWINNENDKRPHPDIRTHVYYYGMNHAGTEAEWDVMFKRFTDENNAAEKVKLMYGLAGIRSSRILKKYINLAMDENYVRSQDALNCLRSISNNPDGTSLVWDWVRENWELLVKRYTLNDRYLGQLLPAITKSFSSKTKLDEIRSFFAKYPEAGAGTIYRAQTIETVETNIKWVENNRMKIDQWLDSSPEPRHVS